MLHHKQQETLTEEEKLRSQKSESPVERGICLNFKHFAFVFLKMSSFGIGDKLLCGAFPRVLL